MSDVAVEHEVDTQARVEAARRQRRAERRVTEHVLGLLDDRRFVVPTAFGPRPVASLPKSVSRWDRALAIKRRMAALDVPDFELQDAMPTGLGFDVGLTRQVLLAFSQPMATVRYASLPAVDDLILGRDPRRLDATAVRESVGELPPPPTADRFGGPMTLVLFAAGGFGEDAKRTARSFVDGPPTILIEPDDAGGFNVVGPPGSEFLCELLDPEQYPERRRRVWAELDRRDIDLLTGGVSLDAVAEATHLNVATVELAAREWANDRRRSGSPALRVKKVEGVPMLYADSSLTTADLGGTGLRLDTGGESTSISVMDRLRRLFGRSVSPQRKIAELSERRAALSRQRDRAYDELGRLEDREQELKIAFKADAAGGSRRRITSQLVQLQKDAERRRQTVGVLNQQINVIGTHLHNLELARAGNAAKLPKSEEIAADAAQAEEVLAELQASSELADELAGHTTGTGLSDEEQRLYDQLAAEADGPAEAEPPPAFAREVPALKPAPETPEAKPDPPARVELPPDDDEPAPAARRAEAEAG